MMDLSQKKIKNKKVMMDNKTRSIHALLPSGDNEIVITNTREYHKG